MEKMHGRLLFALNRRGDIIIEDMYWDMHIRDNGMWTARCFIPRKKWTVPESIFDGEISMNIDIIDDNKDWGHGLMEDIRKDKDGDISFLVKGMTNWFFNFGEQK